MTETQKKVCIIGAGVSGLALAAALHKKKIPFHIFEKKSEAKSSLGAGLVLQANAMKVLDLLGLKNAVIESGKILDSISIYNDNGNRVNTLDQEYLYRATGERAVAISRKDLNHILQSNFPPDSVSYDAEFSSFTQAENSVEVVFQNSEKRKYTFIVGADGLHSSL